MNRQSDELLRPYRILFSLFLILCADQCLAALEDYSEQSLIGDMPVVLSASRLRQPLSETPNAVTVIDRAMIKDSGFRTTADLFRLVPGMYVDYQDGYTPLVGYRGSTDAYPRRMQVLVDGRSVLMPPFNIVDWQDLPLHIDDIERIEVVRGPAATSYGTNSILGVINIITRDASALKGASVSVTKGNVGNAGISDAVAHLGGGVDNFDYRLSVGMQSDNGFNFPENYPIVFAGYNNSSTTHLVSLRGNYHPNITDSFDFQLGYSDGIRATGNPADLMNQPHSMQMNSAYQQLTWVRALDKGDEIQAHYYHISHNFYDEAMSAPLPFAGGGSYLISNNYRVNREEIELQHTLHTSLDNRLVWGLATRYDSADDPSVFLAPQSAQQYRLFVHDEWRILPPLLVNAGVMLENDGMGNKNTSPRMAINYHLTPEHTLRTSVSVAYRNPGFPEENSNSRYVLGSYIYQQWYSSGHVRPERALSREVGYVGKLANNLSIDVRAYNDQVNDIIWVDATQVSVPGFTMVNPNAPWDFRNEFSAHYTGLEGTIKYAWEANSLTLNYAHQIVSAVLLGSPITPSFLPSALGFAQGFSNTAPVNSGSVLYARNMNEGISFSAGYYQQGYVMVLDGTAPQQLSRRLDLRVAKHYGHTDDSNIGGGEVALVVQNAFQENIVGYSGYVFNRRAYVMATIGF